MAPVAHVKDDSRAANSVLARLGAFVALTKPRIIELLLITTVPTMFVARRGVPSLLLIAEVLVGGTLAAGGANAMNMIYDRDIDAVMERTRRRPLVTGAVSVRSALVFAIVLEIGAFMLLWTRVNLLSAVLAVSATAFYVGVYTMWLKRHSSQNIVIGGAAGAVPVLIGWSAVTDRLGLAPVVLFAVIFFWTPPHFWALAIRYREDYASAEVPMLPVVASTRSVVRQMVAYTVVLIICSILLEPATHLGPVYLAVACVLGVVYLARTATLMRDPTERRAMRLFGFSITYLTVLFVSMGVIAGVAHT